MVCEYPHCAFRNPLYQERYIVLSETVPIVPIVADIAQYVG